MLNGETWQEKTYAVSFHDIKLYESKQIYTGRKQMSGCLWERSKESEGTDYEMVQDLFCKGWMPSLLIVNVSLWKHVHLKIFKVIYCF